MQLEIWQPVTQKKQLVAKWNSFREHTESLEPPNKRNNVGMATRAMRQFRKVEIGGDTRTVTNIRRPRKRQQESDDPRHGPTAALNPEQAHINIVLEERTNAANTSGMSAGGESSITTPRSRISLEPTGTPFSGCDYTYSGRRSGDPCKKTMTDFRHRPMLAEPGAPSDFSGDLCQGREYT